MIPVNTIAKRANSMSRKLSLEIIVELVKTFDLKADAIRDCRGIIDG